MRIALYKVKLVIPDENILREELSSLDTEFSADVLVVPSNELNAVLQSQSSQNAHIILFVDDEFKPAQAEKILAYSNFDYSSQKTVEQINWKEWFEIETLKNRQTHSQIEHYSTYKSIVNSLVDPILVLSRDYKILDGNPAMFKTFGEDIIGNELSALTPDAFESIKDDLENGNSVRGVEVRLQWKETKTPFICSVWKEDSYEVGTKYFALLHDLTNRLSLEKEMKRAEKMSMISRLTRSIGHEVRNPLNNVNLALDALKEDIQEIEDDDIYIEIIERNAKRIDELISELLESSKPAALKVKTVSVRKVINGVIGKAGDRFRLKQIRLIQKFSCSNVYLQADSQKLEIALLNLIINAVEAVKMETGKVILYCEQDENHVYFKIADNGVGMSEEELKVLFDPFYTNKKGGVGLGLTTTQNIINAHRGKIDVMSQLNEGTEFIIQLPVFKKV